MIPVFAAILNLVIRERENFRDFLTFIASVLTFFCVLAILISVGNKTTEEIVLLSVIPGLKISFQVEPLGLLFALLASGLWILTHVYAVGYMRENKEAKHSKFFAY
ncbi:monovalent cation/H+ antiporter subunit D family protein, partial [bacterium]|nr:monovalent cation/H+ antiporter subunit D family protein [bacterium]